MVEGIYSKFGDFAAIVKLDQMLENLEYLTVLWYNITIEKSM